MGMAVPLLSPKSCCGDLNQLLLVQLARGILANPSQVVFLRSLSTPFCSPCLSEASPGKANRAKGPMCPKSPARWGHGAELPAAPGGNHTSWDWGQAPEAGAGQFQHPLPLRTWLLLID